MLSKKEGLEKHLNYLRSRLETSQALAAYHREMAENTLTSILKLRRQILEIEKDEK